MNQHRAILLLIVLFPIALVFGPALASDRTFAMRDAAHFYYPLFEWIGQEWAAGRVPLWNPYENGGLPVVADASSSIFYPGKLLFALPLGFGFNYKLYITLHVLLAAGGVYRLARHWQASGYAAAVAAVAYALGGNVVFQYCNVVFLVGAAWLPWAVWATDVTLVQRSWRGALGLGTVLALMTLGGDPQAAFHSLLLAGAYFLFLSWREPGTELPPPLQRFAGRGLLLALAAGVGFLLAAVQVLPSSEAARGSERAAYNSPRNIYEAAEFLSRSEPPALPAGAPKQSVAQGFFGQPDPTGHHERVYDFSLAPWRVAEFIWPNISGRMFPTKRRWMAELMSEGRVWTPTVYMGLLPVLLALGQLRFRTGDARTRWLSWMLVLFLLASFGYFGMGWLIHWLAREIASVRGLPPPEPGWLGNPVGGLYWLLVTLLPKYVYFRYPAKLLVVVSLVVSLLAARGWDQAFHSESPRLPWVLKWLGIGSLAAAAVAWIGLGMIKIEGWRADAALGPFDAAGAKWDILTALLQTGIVCLCMRELFKRARQEPAANWQALAALLVAAELTVANVWLVQTGPAQLWREQASTAATIFSQRVGPAENSPAGLPPRVFRGRFSGWRPESFAKEISRQRMVEIDRWERDTLFPKYQMPAGISLVESYGSLKSLDYQVLLDMAKLSGPKQADGARLPHPAVLRLLGTEHLLLPASYQPGFAEIVEPSAAAAEEWPENALLWKMKRTLPRAWIVHEALLLPPLENPRNMAAVEARSLEVLFAERKARDFSKLAVVETEQPLRLVTSAAAAETLAADESCRLTLYEPQRVRIEATLAQPGIVVLSDVLAPGWIATLESDGAAESRREVPILLTNRVLRGVELPAGKHVLEFRYRPDSFYRGAAISAVSWLLLGVVVVGVTLYSKRQRGKSADTTNALAGASGW